MDYFAHPAISNSKLGWYKQSPAHFKYFQEHGKEDRPSYLIGSASHTILFEPDKFDGIYHLMDETKRPFPDSDFRNKYNKIWKEEIYEAYSNKKIITIQEYDMINFMMEALHENMQVKELLAESIFERETFWTDTTTGIDCKKKVDIISKSGLFRGDYKTTDNADPYKWQKKAWSMDYYRQAGFYSLEDDINKPIPFWFIAQEKTAPYGVSVHLCSNDLINYGKDESIKLLFQIKSCEEVDLWPSYEIKSPIPKTSDGKEVYHFDFDIPGWVLQHQ